MEYITFPIYLLDKIRDSYDKPDLKTILVYAELASQKTSTGEYKPRSYSELCDKYILSAAQVRKAVRKLEDMGILERDYVPILKPGSTKSRGNDFFIRLTGEVRADA